MEVSVVITRKNQLDYLKRTLAILKKQTFKKPFEIVIVDSGSTDGALEFALKSGVKVLQIPAEHFNYAYSMNTGARAARGKYIVRLSGDCVPVGTQFLTEVVRGFTDDRVGAVFGKYVLEGKKGYSYPNFWPASRFPHEWTRYVVKPQLFMGMTWGPISVGPRAYDLTGGCFGFRKDLWKKRGFNEKFLAGEDAEYAWFLHLIGYDIVYNPAVQVFHEHKINRIETAKAYSGLSDWSFVFTREIMKYWLGRLVGIDPYRSLGLSNQSIIKK